MAAALDKAAVIRRSEIRACPGSAAVVETLTSVSGMAQTAPGTLPNAQGRLRTRLLQVMARQDGEWKVVAYHNVDVKPGVSVPDAK